MPVVGGREIVVIFTAAQPFHALRAAKMGANDSRHFPPFHLSFIHFTPLPSILGRRVCSASATCHQAVLQQVKTAQSRGAEDRFPQITPCSSSAKLNTNRTSLISRTTFACHHTCENLHLFTMSARFESLPAEILAKIFEYHTDDRKQIGSCRLVSHTFKTASSPFLITKLVFAKRLREIAKAIELASHPYFSYFITEIVYDLSHWQSLEYDQYIDDCNEVEALGLRHFCDAEWYWNTLAEDAFRSSVYRGAAFRPPNSASSFLARTTDGRKKYHWRSYDDVLQSAWAASTPGDSDLNRMGCHLSFPRYERYREFHEAFRWRGRYLDTLIEIAGQLPKLRAA